eukprot:COSAG01_NODE_52831_length_342_cov_7.508197_2_plen_22_part_01
MDVRWNLCVYARSMHRPDETRV